MVLMILGLALLSLVQLPAQDPPRPAAREVILKLSSGKELRGRVMAQTARYVELKTGDGIVVGLDRRRIQTIQPVLETTPKPAEPATKGSTPPPAAPPAPLVSEEARRARAAGQDLIYLDGGRLITGRLVKLSPDFIEIELAPGTVVGFDRSKVVRMDTARSRGVVPAPRQRVRAPATLARGAMGLPPGLVPQRPSPGRRAQVSLPVPQARPATPAGGTRVDLIRLKDGEQMVGQILRDAGNYIEIKLAPGTVVGFSKNRVAEIRRAARLRPDTGRAELAARDDWFLLHNGEGRAVGYVHALVQLQGDGRILVSEEWTFHGQARRTAVTVLETLTADLQPLTCFYHERVMGPDERLRAERLVSGTVQGSRLRVETRSLRGHKVQSYKFHPGTCFPLGYRETLRQHPDRAATARVQTVFDPGKAEFRSYRTVGDLVRRVEVAGTVRRVREISIAEGRQRNVEWVDASSRLLRREVNGPALVALPASKGLALRGHFGDSDRDSSLVVSGDGHLALWLPNPIWRPLAEPARGQVSLEAPLYGASVTLMEMDQLDPGLPVDSAADAVLNWLRLSMGKGLKVRQRTGIRVRSRPAMRLDTTWAVTRPGAQRRMQAQTYVFKIGGRYLALCCAGRAASFAQLESDFDRILASVQLDPREIRPELKGPLAGPVR